MRIHVVCAVKNRKALTQQRSGNGEDVRPRKVRSRDAALRREGGTTKKSPAALITPAISSSSFSE
jgi:hypothetical protein